MNLNDICCKYVEELKCFVVESTSPVILVLCVTGNFLISSSSISISVRIFASWSWIRHYAVDMRFVVVESSYSCVIIGNLTEELAYVFIE